MKKYTDVNSNDHVILIQEQQLITPHNDGWRMMSVAHNNDMLCALLEGVELLLVGSYKAGHCYVADIPSSTADHTLLSFRTMMRVVSDDEYQLINRAMQLITWRQQHQFCGQCGEKTVMHAHESAYHCSACDQLYFPRIAPCMMTLVTKGDHCLLAQHQKHRNGFYSTLAGFVEAGESVEACVHREVMEEVGLTVNHLSYYTSQPWPYPQQLMVGYFAEYSGGDIVMQDEEIVDAQWFHYQNLPEIPPPETLSGMMIGEFVKRRTV